jgi:hypothetical protein
MAVAFDEMNGTDGALRPAYGELSRWLAEVPPDVLDYRRREAEVLFRRIGITFAVYGENGTSCAPGSSSASRPSTTTSATSITGGRSSRPESFPRTWCSRTRCSGRK